MRPSTRRRWLIGTVTVLVAALVLVLVVFTRSAGEQPPALPLRSAGEIPLPGTSARFDYVSLDADRGLLFIAHMGANEVIEVDLRAARVVRVIPDLPDVHGVLVVPALRRVFATATGDNEVVALDEDTGEVVTRAPTGEYPDGLAYDPRRNAVWATNEAGGSETVIDANSGVVRGTVELGGEVGNVVYDPTADRMLVAVQGRNVLAVIDPAGLTADRRVPLPGCEHDHGLALDTADRLGFVACDGNATLLTVDLDSWRVLDTDRVGEDPDVLAYDAGARRLYVAAESGTVTVLDLRAHRLTVAGSAHLADGAHVVAVDPRTHHSFYPVPAGTNGRPALLEQKPAR